MAYFFTTTTNNASPNPYNVQAAPNTNTTPFQVTLGPTTTAAAKTVGPVVVTPIIIQNTPPQNITFKNTIILGTTDTNNNNVAISEGYVVSGPTSPGVSPLIIAGGTKAIVPLTTSNAQGSPCLKIHYPVNPLGNALYVTYCVVNNKMADGYYDYITGVPSAYFTALRNWINTAPNGTQYANNDAFTIRERILYFTDYGNLTNKPANSISFQVKFQGTFGPTINNNKLVTAVPTAVVKTQ